MPTSYVKQQAKEKNVSVDRSERQWDKAKEDSARSTGDKDNWALTMHIYQNRMKHLKKKSLLDCSLILEESNSISKTAAMSPAFQKFLLLNLLLPPTIAGTALGLGVAGQVAPYLYDDPIYKFDQVQPESEKKISLLDLALFLENKKINKNAALSPAIQKLLLLNLLLPPAAAAGAFGLGTAGIGAARLYEQNATNEAMKEFEEKYK